MIKISLEKNTNLYTDFSQCLDFLHVINNGDYRYPGKTVNFHIYSEIKNEKELLCVKSYLATQNLDKTRLILWSDYDIQDNPLIQPYKSLINLKVYDPVEETKGTLLKDSQRWITANDTKHYMRSGVLRFLVTHQYGGVWADMDMVFLRDFKPILDQEWAYMWGAELDFANHGPCAAMMNINQKSQHSYLCMNEICLTEVVPDSTVLDHELLAKVYTKNPFTVFPSTFFNTEWQMNTTYENGRRHYDPNGLGTKVESGWFTKNEYSNWLFPGAFAWHWHNSTYKNHTVEKGSKFDLLTDYIDELLVEKGIQ